MYANIYLGGEYIMTWDKIDASSDYAYIAVFIVFLEKIIDIIKGLFSGINLGGGKDDAGEGEGEPTP